MSNKILYFKTLLLVFILPFYSLGNSSNKYIEFNEKSNVCELYVELLKSGLFNVVDSVGNKIDNKTVLLNLFPIDTIIVWENNLNASPYIIIINELNCNGITKFVLKNNNKHFLLGCYIDYYDPTTGNFLYTKQFYWIELPINKHKYKQVKKNALEIPIPGRQVDE